MESTRLSCNNCRLFRCPSCSYYNGKLKYRCSWCSLRSYNNGICNECENPNWTSGNQIIDDFIKECNDPNEILKWVPYDQLSEITYLAEGGFGTVYRAKLKGFFVALKKLRNSQNATVEFLNEVKKYIQCIRSNEESPNVTCLIRLYGVSYDPIIQEFIMVSEYAGHGDLKENLMDPANFVNNSLFDFSFSYEKIIHNIARGLSLMHNSGLVHCDLHPGNILIKKTMEPVTGYKNTRSIYDLYTSTNCIGDFGLSQPANISSSIKSSGIYGVVPYIAPELFRGKPYTQASDIYSLGMIIWAIHSLEQPYNGRCHDAKLILDIIGGLRPEISPNMGMANFCVELVKKCWDPDPNNRPTADQIVQKIKAHNFEDYSYFRSKEYNLLKSFRKKRSLLKAMNLIHNSGVFYTSRFLSFQKVKDHLSKLSSDSGQGDPSLPSTIKDFGNETIALPTLSNTQNSEEYVSRECELDITIQSLSSRNTNSVQNLLRPNDPNTSSENQSPSRKRNIEELDVEIQNNDDDLNSETQD